MGQYHLTINIDKREYIYPHKIGLGLKLREQYGFAGSTADILFMLLACSNGRGGGDIDTEHPELIGRWAGDRIAVIGDYCENDDIPELDVKKIHLLCHEEKYLDPADVERFKATGETLFRDISDELIPLINEQFDTGLVASGEGWRDRNKMPPMSPDMILRFPKND